MIGRVKRLLPLVLLVFLGVGCGSSNACPHGGEIVFRAVPLHGQAVTPSGMQIARNIIESRVQTIGVGSPKVTLRGSDEIVVDYAGTHAPASLSRVISVTGQLQFFDFEKALAPPTVNNGVPTPYPTLYSLLTAVKPVQNWGPPQAYEAYYLFDSRAPHRLIHGPAGTLHELLEPSGGKTPKGTTILVVPAGTEVVSGPAETSSTQPVTSSPSGVYWYLFKLPPALSSSDIDESAVTAGRDQIGVPEVTLGFTGHGAKAFQAITKAEYERGRLVAGLHGSAGRLNQVYAQHSAIVLDGRLQATPYIDYTDSALSLGIAGGNAVINNMGSIQAANNLALVLQTGSLPYRLIQVSAKAGCAR